MIVLITQAYSTKRVPRNTRIIGRGNCEKHAGLGFEHCHHCGQFIIHCCLQARRKYCLFNILVICYMGGQFDPQGQLLEKSSYRTTLMACQTLGWVMVPICVKESAVTSYSRMVSPAPSPQPPVSIKMGLL